MNNSPDTNTTRDDDNAESSEDPGNFFFYCWSIYGRRIYGGVYTSLDEMFEFWLILYTKYFFASVIKIILGAFD